MAQHKALLVGHFSTIGDIESLQVVQSWLDAADFAYDVASFRESVHACMPEALALASLEPATYTHLVVICGPVWPGQLDEAGFDLDAYIQCVRIGINLTMVEPTADWNPFDVLLERDSDRMVRADLTFLADTPAARQVVGRCMVRRQSSYTGREAHERARELIDSAIERHDFAVLDLDTRWYLDNNGLANAGRFIAALQRVDLLLTNRLHGMVYAVKAGVPVVAIDAIEGGAKLTAQAGVIGWPQCLRIEELDDAGLDQAIDWCLQSAAAKKAAACRQRAESGLRSMRAEFMQALMTVPDATIRT